MGAFFGCALHPVFEMVALPGFALMYPADFLGFVVIIAVKGDAAGPVERRFFALWR